MWTVNEFSVPEVLDGATARRQLQKVDQKLQLLVNLSRCHAGHPAKVHHRLPYRELPVQSDLLHTTNYGKHTRVGIKESSSGWMR